MDSEKRCTISIRKGLFERLQKARGGQTWDDYYDVHSKRFRKHIYYLRQKYGMRIFHEVGRLDQSTDEYTVLVYRPAIR
jgi:hypothetical protein